MDASVRATDALLQHALHMKAREVHMEPTAQGVRIRYRLGSSLYDALNIPAHAAPSLGARLKSLANIPLLETLGSGRFKMSPEGANSVVSVAVSTTPVVLESGRADKFVLSFTHEHAGKSGFSLSALGVSPHTREHITQLLHQKSGLVLVCGPKGSGKTSMLYTLLDECTDTPKHIASVEDSVSYVLSSVTQMEVNESLGLTALSCVRTQLRHHPDILMIDCALTEELVLLAAQAANRGILVLLGVEAATAGEGIARMLGLSVPPELLAAVCIGSVSVYTAPRLCAHKKTPYKLTRAEQTLLEDTIDIKETLAALKKEQVIDVRTAWKDIELYKPKACPECEEGFAGFIGIQEVVLVSRMLKELVRDGASVYELEMQAKREGVLTLAEDALYKAIQGVVSADLVLEVAAGYQARYS
jgi:type II secretory ATPase GspE/PulE/Tfp pilus assembly ATPase PilB-like protein